MWSNLKNATGIYLLTALCSVVIGCSSIASASETGSLAPAIRPAPSLTPSPAQISLILSSDYNVAEAALLRAVREKNRHLVQNGLKSRFIELKKTSVEALSDMNDRSAVPVLVDALRQNQGVIAGGSETQILQNELNKVIVLALEHLTGLKFHVTARLTKEMIRQYRPFSSEELQEISTKTGQWCQTDKKCVKSQDQ